MVWTKHCVKWVHEACAFKLSKKKLEFIGAFVISITAILLVINSHQDIGMRDDLTLVSIQRTNTYNFFQAKRTRQFMQEMMVEELQTVKDVSPDLKSDRQARIESSIVRLEHKIAEFNDKSHPDSRHQLLATVKVHEDYLQDLRLREPRLAMAGNIYQVAVILTSLALIIQSPMILLISILVCLMGGCFHVYGLFLI